MCRHLAYLGEPASPAGPLVGAPHALLAQSYAPADMRGGGTVNADGFGFAWLPGDREPPVRYRRSRPMWTDETLPRLAGTLRPSAFVGAVRSGTPGMPVEEGACAPLIDEEWMFSHNGVVAGWPSSVAGLAEKLPVTDLLGLESRTDSSLLWALLRHRLAAGGDPAADVAELVSDVERAAPGSRLNLVLAGRGLLVATTWRHSLSLRVTAAGVTVASEPYDDDPAWQEVPDGCLVAARTDGRRITVSSTGIGEGRPEWA